MLSYTNKELPKPQLATDRSTGAPVCLIVDDEPLLTQFIASVATEAGWLADVAVTAPKFEEALEGRHPNLIALDLAMPERDGVELIRYLAEVSYSGKLIIVSACDQSVLEASMSLAALHGLQVLACAQKPVTAAELRVLLELARPDPALKTHRRN